MYVIQYSKVKDRKQYRKMLRRLRKLEKHGRIVKLKSTIVLKDKELLNQITEWIPKSCREMVVIMNLDRWLK